MGCIRTYFKGYFKVKKKKEKNMENMDESF